MMADYVKLILEAVSRLEAKLKPRESSRASQKETSGDPLAEGDHQRLVLLSQLDETKRILDALHQPTLAGHKPVHRELYRAVIHTETFAREWWSSKESGGTHNAPAFSKWREHFLEFLLAVRWWTMVTALQGGAKYARSEIYGNMFSMKRKSASPVNYQSPWSCERQLPSYGFEIWLQEPECRDLNEILQWEIESGNIFGEDECMARTALETVRNADFPGFVTKGMLASYRYVFEAESPLIEEEITMDLTRDFLGASQSGSWVIRTKCQGVDCALKRVNGGISVQPAIAHLSHPHIVQLMHYWRKDEDMFLVMELMEGDLTDLLSRHKRANESLLSLPVAVDIMLQTAKGMLYLHDLGITFSHLNCSNVLFKKFDTRLEVLMPDDGYIDQYTIKLNGGGYSMISVLDDSNGRKTQDVYRFGLFCLELLTGRHQSEDFLDALADTRPSIPETIPPILKFCIASCFEGHLQLGFGQVITLLLLAQYQVLKDQKNEVAPSFGIEDHELVELNQHGKLPLKHEMSLLKFLQTIIFKAFLTFNRCD